MAARSELRRLFVGEDRQLRHLRQLRRVLGYWESGGGVAAGGGAADRRDVQAEGVSKLRARLKRQREELLVAVATIRTLRRCA